MYLSDGFCPIMPHLHKRIQIHAETDVFPLICIGPCLCHLMITTIDKNESITPNPQHIASIQTCMMLFSSHYCNGFYVKQRKRFCDFNE